MRLRNNPKAYDIMEENADFVILDPESQKKRIDVFYVKFQNVKNTVQLIHKYQQ